MTIGQDNRGGQIFQYSGLKKKALGETKMSKMNKGKGIRTKMECI